MKTSNIQIIIYFFLFTQNIFAENISDDDTYILGKSFFEKPWVAAPSSTTARDGIGPLFNENACINCHPTSKESFANGSNKFVIQLKNTHTIYGSQIATKSSNGVPKEADVKINWIPKTIQYPDGKTITLQKPIITLTNLGYGTLTSSVVMKISPNLNGVGLLEKIPNKPNNRFNLSATTGSVLEQVANAAHNDMSLTNPIYPEENCTPQQQKCNNFQQKELDLPMFRLQAITHYIKNLNKVSSQKPIALFTKIGCDSCHTPKYSLENKTIYPYTDVLTHNLGEGKFRTSPLWNSSKKTNFWHDGRAKNVEEAILWHDGAGKNAKINFMNLEKYQRQKLLNFLQTL